MKIKEHLSAYYVHGETEIIAEIRLHLDDVLSQSTEGLRLTAVVAPMDSVLRNLYLTGKDRIPFQFFYKDEKQGFVRPTGFVRVGLETAGEELLHLEV